MRTRAFLWIAAALAVVALAGGVWFASRPAPAKVESFGEPSVGGPFQLVDQHGAPPVLGRRFVDAWRAGH